MVEILKQRAQFHSLADLTGDDWKICKEADGLYAEGHADRVMAHLKLLEGEPVSLAVDRLEHSLQTATRACEAGRDEEYVVCALLHDIGDMLGTHNHAGIAAAILKPFVSEQNHWMILNHGIFQGYYYFELDGLDRNARDKFRENPYFDATEEFCRLYDQTSFDPNYKSMPLKSFEPMLRRVLQAPKPRS
ncbi:HD domain-containing protein [Bradyrhizobium elkanii]|uniref:HD domain-containing protein n=1 Tax=Bradyrhizobium elkanii TaxID=29448 RepID=UPI001BA48410|nr:HD domain-containing protein [Bradyrhizobium elkanii]MBR1165266.1 HD domain-containing protein [Bradyrhizobium elkanii]